MPSRTWTASIRSTPATCSSAARRSSAPRPVGILELLSEYKIPLAGQKAVVVGRSNIVGKPVAHLLLQQNATVTICHSRTVDLARETLDADVLVVAVGMAGLVTADMVKAGATVIDVGMNRTEGGLVGDVDPGAMEVAGLHDARSRRRGAADDRVSAPKHGQGSALSPRRPCIPP